jgi:chitodextrinase
VEQQQSPAPLKPFTRRKFLSSATASLSVLALAACGGGDEEDGTMSALAKGGVKGRPQRTGDTTAPSMPTGVSATASSASSITVTWGASTDNVGVNLYRLYRCTGSSCTSFAQIANVAETSYTDGSLSASTAYSYRVAAVDAAGNVSELSAIASATTEPLANPAPADTTPPSVPTGVAATAASSTSITVTWSASTDNVGVAGYILYRCSGSGCTPVTEIARPTATSYTDSGVSAGTSYSYKVAAVDAAGNVSAPSSPALATTPAANAPITWQVDPSPVLTAGSSNAFDLSQTLPQGVVRGGVFSVDPSGSPLPSGVTLTSTGLLSASSGASGSFSGVVFAYREPA